MNDYLNIAITAVFAVLSVIMMTRWAKFHNKIIIQDQQWSTMRMVLLAFGLLTVFSLFANPSNSIYDYCRIVATIIAVTAYMACRDGVGEEGLVAGSKFFPWSEVKAWDHEDRKKVVAVYFQVNSQNEKKPDAYTTKELDFSLTDKYNLMKFLNLNLSRKYTRMKKKA